jgi:HEAT repeat protein
MVDDKTDLDVTFSEVIAALLDEDTPLNPRNLYRLSDLTSKELAEFKKAWPRIPIWRRQALLEDLEQMFENDNLLSFESICRFAMTDPEPKVRFVAIYSLQEYQVKDLIPSFIQIMEKESDEELRALAVSVLGKYIYYGELEEVPKDLQKNLEKRLLGIANGSDSSLVRRRAIESLGFSSQRDVPRLIQTAFDTHDEDWMTSALFAMGRSCDNRWDKEVLAMLSHTSPKIRCEAARAAGELEISQAKPQLIELLDDGDPNVRMASIWSLSQIGGSGLQQIFERMLDEMDFDQEARFIEDALDNLLFNQSIGLHDPFDFKDDFDDQDDLDFDELDNSYEDY